MTTLTHAKPLSRRRFLSISAAAAGMAITPGLAIGAPAIQRWRGVALGAGAEVRLVDPDRDHARKVFAAMETEILRLERVFSLYRTDSALTRLNREGRIMATPPELVDLLATVRSIHKTTAGAFDPSIQPLWDLYARTYAGESREAEARPAPEDIDRILELTGFDKVRIDPERVTYDRPGMALTLNGIAQGYMTDRVSALLKNEGFTDILVNIGEIAASGSDPAGPDGWEVLLAPGEVEQGSRIVLKDRAVATSALSGTTFDREARVSHILDPRTGRPARSGLAGASVVASSATIADGLSTAALVCGEQVLAEALDGFAGAQAFLLRTDGSEAVLRVST